MESIEAKTKEKAAGKRLVNIQELSHLLGLSVNTLYTWVSQKRIPYVKCGRLTKFDVREIDKWIEGNSVNPKVFF